MRILSSMLLAALMAVILSTSAQADDIAPTQELTVTRVTPEGEDVSGLRQIVVTFNRPVVPLGRMERTDDEVQIKFSPAVTCQWRWINTTSLACNLNDKDTLRQSTRYDMEIGTAIKAEDGASLKEPYRHIFVTQRADERYSDFKQWKSPSSPVVRVTLNQSVTQKSLEKSLSFRLPAGDRVAIKASPDLDYQTQPDIIVVPGEKAVMFTGDQPSRKSDDDWRKLAGQEARRVWLVEPVRELPQDAHVSLMLDAGLVSAMGPEPSVAERELVAFDTFPAFSVLGVRCRTNDDQEVLFKPGEAEGRQCNPLAPVSLSFSVPVMRSQVKKNFVFEPKLGNDANQDGIWGDLSNEYSRLGSAYEKARTYDVYLPYGLKAEQTYKISMKEPELGFVARVLRWVKSLFVEVPQTALEDEFGRRLQNPVSVTFTTSRRKPNFELVHHTAVLDKQSDSDVPLYVNNLEKTGFRYSRMTSKGVEANLLRETVLPKIDNVQFAVPFGVREALDGQSGVVMGNLETTPVIADRYPGAYWLFGQVTPWQVHVKLGHFSTLVWVTDMANGNPVQDAKVSIYADTVKTLTAAPKTLASATTGQDGRAQLSGSQDIDPDLAIMNSWDENKPKLFVRVDKGDDIALMPLTYDFAIDTWRASNENIYAVNRRKYGHMISWGTTAQGIYRAGDTIQYKIYVRNQDIKTLTPPPREGYTLEVVDPKDNVVETVESLKLSEFGAFAGEFKVAKEAPVGWYEFRLKASFTGKDDNENEEGEEGRQGAASWRPMRVLVSDFTPAPFKVENSLNGDLFRAGENVEVSTGAKMHAGGPYTDANARMTAIVESRGFSSKDPVASSFYFSTSGQDSGSRQVFQKIDPVDAKGELTTSFTLPDINVYYGRLNVESAVQDDRGKYIAAMASADYVGRDRFVGVKSPQWVYAANKAATIQHIVVDEKGVPVKGVAVHVDIERQVTTAARVKGAGNAYITNYNTEWKHEADCDAASADSAVDCTFTPTQAGSWRVMASIKDTKGRDHATETVLWVTGNEYVLWNDESDVLLPIVPEKPEYHVGDKARYLVKNPYPGAKALVTIERYGVIDSFVTTLEGSTPVIEFDVKPDYMPGFYMSVMVVSPRVDKPVDENQVDLGKPSFRMGYVTVPVKDAYKEMIVTAKAAQDVYRPREKVKVLLHAEPRMKPQGAREPIEIAVAVLDESVFDLVTGGASNFDPYNGFYKLDGLDLRNYNLLTRLIGRQKFEKKGANQGGDGGSDLNMRDLFKFVAYWNPSLKTDAQGNAEVTFDAPDNLTGWRVLALAVTPSDRLGLGQGNFKVNRPTETRPVMPNQVTERDSFRAGFSVMNRTDKPREMKVTIRASGDIDAQDSKAEKTETLTLEPYKRKTVFMDVKAAKLAESADARQGNIHFVVEAGDASDRDGMVHNVPVNKMRSLETAATYGTTTEQSVSENISFPADIYPDVGSVSVVLSPSVISSVEGAFKYMRDYPYFCWEQILTKGVMASHYLNLKAYMPESFKWDDSAKLAQAGLDAASSFQAPNGGMAYFVARDDYADPYLSAYTALAFNWLKAAGYKVPETVEAKLQDYLLNFLRNDTAPTFYSEGMRSTVRAVALAALAENGKATGDDVDRYHPHVKEMSLFGKAYYLSAALKTGKEDIAAETAKMILSAGNQTSGKFMFSEEQDDSYTRILATPLRDNCAILDVFTDFAASKSGKDMVGDVPFKLVRSITQTRQNRDHWENTQENMFCMNALAHYSRVYESVKPDMTVKAAVDGKPFGETAFDDLRDVPVTLQRPIEAADAGRAAKLTMDKLGDGRFYYAARLQYAPRADASKPVNAGMELVREMSVEREGAWQLLKPQDKVKRGDVVRVDLYLSVPAARNFVAVNDPVPGGLEPVNRDLATSSTVDADKGAFQAAGGSWYFKFNDWIGYNVSRWSFYHQELRHDSVRFYADYLPAGNYHLSYTAQAIASGNFAVMPTLAEEMYDPDVYGKAVAAELGVDETTP